MSPPETEIKILAIAASTGGPKTLVDFLNILSPKLPIPIALTQHITPNFVPGFVKWLGENTHFRSHMVTGPVIPQSGTLYHACQGCHLEIELNQFTINKGPPECYQRPSANVMFRSMAKTYGPKSVGVILTGMGEDGATGLLSLRKAGGRTLGQSKESCVVYGMPRVANEIGAVEKELPLEMIPRVINRLLGQNDSPPASRISSRQSNS